MTSAKQIFVPNGTGQYKFYEDVLQTIFSKSLDESRKIVSISVTGAFRTGKSFILNYFLRYLKAHYVWHDATNWLGDKNEPLQGFDWLASLDPVTNGIMIWPEIFLHDDLANDEKYAIVIMDTQGFFEPGSRKSDHSAIFGLCSAMASTNIYNIWKDFTQAQLEHIHQFSIEGTSRMRLKQKTPFQRLVLLLRDYDTTELSYGFEGGKKLLDNRMQNDLEMPDLPIHDFFKSIECFLMCKHSVNAARNDKFNGSLAMLDEEFIQLLKIFVPKVLAPSQLKPKTLNGLVLNTKNFVRIFAYYAAYFREGELKVVVNEEIRRAFNDDLNISCVALEALHVSIEHYNHFMEAVKETLESNFDLLQFYHEDAKKKSLKFYNDQNKESHTDTALIVAAYRRKLLKDLDEIYRVAFQGSVSDEKEKKVARFYERLGLHINHSLNSIVSFFSLIGGALGALWRRLPDKTRDHIEETFFRVLAEKCVEEIEKMFASA